MAFVPHVPVPYRGRIRESSPLMRSLVSGPDYELHTNSDQPLLLDIRSKKEYQQCHIPSAILVETPLPPLNIRNINVLRKKLTNLTQNLDIDHLIFVYCKKGVRSSMAQEILQNLGFTNVENLGGVEIPPLRHLLDC